MGSKTPGSVKSGNKKGRSADGRAALEGDERSAGGGAGDHGGRAGGDGGIVRLTQAFEAAIGLADFGAEAAADEILQLLVGAEAQHFFSAADGISSFQILINNLKKVVKPEGLFVRKYGDQFISYMIWNPS